MLLIWPYLCVLRHLKEASGRHASLAMPLVGMLSVVELAWHRRQGPVCRYSMPNLHSRMHKWVQSRIATIGLYRVLGGQLHRILPAVVICFTRQTGCNLNSPYAIPNNACIPAFFLHFYPTSGGMLGNASLMGLGSVPTCVLCM